MGPVRSDQVFLVQGQSVHSSASGGQEKSSVMEQCIVVADGYKQAYQCLAEQKPNFRMVGFATLADYESTARSMRAALKRESTVWPVLLAAGQEG